MVDVHVVQLIVAEGVDDRIVAAHRRRRELSDAAGAEVAAAQTRLERTISAVVEMDDAALARRAIREAEDAVRPLNP